jgi:hypothetical protein
MTDPIFEKFAKNARHHNGEYLIQCSNGNILAADSPAKLRQLYEAEEGRYSMMIRRARKTKRKS